MPPKNRPIRLAVVVQHPIHYHLPLYRAMVADPHIDVNVLYMQRAWSESGFDPEVAMVVDWGVPMFEGYPYQVFRNASPRRDGEGFWKFINPGLIWRVMTGAYDVVYVHGHNHFTHVMCMVAARLGGKRLILRTDGYNLGERPLVRKILRWVLYRLLYKLPQVCLYVGTYNREYFESFGVPDARLVYAPYAVDNAYFTEQARRLGGQKAALKAEFGIAPDASVILFPAKFMEKKQPLRLIEAFCRAGLGDGWALLMVGDGALRPAAEALAARRPDKKIIFAGFLDQSRISRGYAVGEIVALPSAYQETWGLVINEALNFGCAVIVSDRVACGPDLVADACGLIVPWDDTDALADALRRLAGDAALRRRFQEQARARIKRWSVDNYMAGLREALGLSPAPRDAG